MKEERTGVFDDANVAKDDEDDDDDGDDGTEETVESGV